MNGAGDAFACPAISADGYSPQTNRPDRHVILDLIKAL